MFQAIRLSRVGISIILIVLGTVVSGCKSDEDNTANHETTSKLNDLKIKNFNPGKPSALDAFLYLEKGSHAVDPEKLGIAFKLEVPFESLNNQKINPKQVKPNSTLMEILEYLCETTNSQWSLNNGLIVVTPK